MTRWVGVLGLALVGCGVNQTEHERVVVERDMLHAKVGDLEDRVSALDEQKRELEARVEQLTSSQAREATQRGKIKDARRALGIEDGGRLVATLKTSLGDIECDLWTNVAPLTVRNFVELAEGTKSWTDPRTGASTQKPLYDEPIFHRVIPDFMIQGGDPLGTGTGGPGYRFEDEVDSSVRFEQPGLLAMANSGPGTNGSQFFITDSTPTHLNMKHTIFGRCADMEVVRSIMAVDLTGPQGSTPEEDVVLRTVSIGRK